MTKIVFLGTGGMVPTKDRNVQSIYLEYNGEGMLIDCGEGTQRQMNIAGINRLKIRKILISHWHGDHVAGLLGLIQTLGNTEEPKELTIYGPKGSQFYLDHLLQSCSFDQRLPIKLVEIESTSTPLTFYENEDYQLQAAKLEHRIPCIGFSFIEKDQRKINMTKAKELGLSEGPDLGKLQRGETIVFKDKKITPAMVSTIKKGKKITFILDTEPCPGMNKLAENADLLISEANFDSELEEKAQNSMHLTAQVVAQVASQCNVKQLILTHFSQRYKSVEKLEADAKKVFDNTTCAFDFMKINI